MNVWEHFFLTGEFAARAHILDGLTIQQAGMRPGGAPHSIYEELWHAAEWQRIVLDGDEAAQKNWEQFPSRPDPENEAAWHALVQRFINDSERAVALAQDEAWLETDERGDTPGITWRVALESVAIHSAYHLGKIVLLRQLMGVWSPPPATTSQGDSA